MQLDVVLEFHNADKQHSKVPEFETNQLDGKLLLPALPPSAPEPHDTAFSNVADSNFGNVHPPAC